MCGRFTQMYTWRELVALCRLTDPSPPSNLQPRYNICPTRTIDAAIERDGKRKLEQMRWGLAPSWWNKPLKELRLATFNARAETVAEKPFFRSSFKLVITQANKFVAGIHDRMPVILEEKQFDGWLDDNAVPASLVKMLKPAGERILTGHPVSNRVNSSRADSDDATLIDEAAL